jgi:FkbM family methyltransferase
MGLLGELRIHCRDVKHFGLGILARFLRRQDANGYIVMTTRFGPFFLRPSETDLLVLRQIFVNREYDLEVFPQGEVIRNAYNDCLQRGKTPLIIDAGANAGYSARFFAHAYPGARIFAVEPDPNNADLCRENTRNLPQIEVLEAAIGAQAGHVIVEYRSEGAGAARTRLARSGVPVVTINDLVSRCEDAELLIVKVDIEGFESNLFSGATEWIEQTVAVVVEPHDWMLPGSGSSRTLQQAMCDGSRDILISGENLVWVRRPPASGIPLSEVEPSARRSLVGASPMRVV